MWEPSTVDFVVAPMVQDPPLPSSRPGKSSCSSWVNHLFLWSIFHSSLYVYQRVYTTIHNDVNNFSRVKWDGFRHLHGERYELWRWEKIMGLVRPGSDQKHSVEKFRWERIMVLVMTMIMLMIMVMIMVMIFYDYGYDSHDISLWSSFPWESNSGSLNPSWRQPNRVWW